MNNIDIFESLNENMNKLSKIYSEISDSYRGISDFDIIYTGKSQFIGSINGQILLKQLSEMINNVNLNIDEIILKINVNRKFTEEEKIKINNELIDFTITCKYLAMKNKLFYENNNIDQCERNEINNYYEQYFQKIKLLDKELTDKKNVLDLNTINETMDIINEMRKVNMV